MSGSCLKQTQLLKEKRHISNNRKSKGRLCLRRHKGVSFKTYQGKEKYDGGGVMRRDGGGKRKQD